MYLCIYNKVIPISINLDQLIYIRTIKILEINMITRRMMIHLEYTNLRWRRSSYF